MNRLEKRPEWFQTVPLIQATESYFDMTEYFGDFEVDTNTKQGIAKVLRMSKLARLSVATKKGKPFPNDLKLQKYRKMIADISCGELVDTEECVELNNKIDALDEDGLGFYWELLGTYKGFQILQSLEGGEILVSQPDGPCFQTRDGWTRFCEIDACELENAGIADAQEFIDAYISTVTAVGQLSLDLKVAIA
jgi:hypothetical protein